MCLQVTKGLFNNLQRKVKKMKQKETFEGYISMVKEKF